MINDSLRQNAVTRLTVYSFLAEIFLQEPSPSRWPEQRQALIELLKEQGENQDLNESLGNIVPEDLTTTVAKLRQEFYDCFFVPMSKSYVPPFESALQNFIPGKRKPFGPLNSTEGSHVAKCYGAVGFNPRELNLFAPLREIRLPDHIGFELAFMARLCFSEIEAWKSGQLGKVRQWQNLEKQFLNDHLQQFLTHFASAMEEKAPGFYARAARAAQQWVVSDYQDLAEGVLIA